MALCEFYEQAMRWQGRAPWERKAAEDARRMLSIRVTRDRAHSNVSANCCSLRAAARSR